MSRGTWSGSETGTVTNEEGGASDSLEARTLTLRNEGGNVLSTQRSRTESRVKQSRLICPKTTSGGEWESASKIEDDGFKELTKAPCWERLSPKVPWPSRGNGGRATDSALLSSTPNQGE